MLTREVAARHQPDTTHPGWGSEGRHSFLLSSTCQRRSCRSRATDRLGYRITVAEGCPPSSVPVHDERKYFRPTAWTYRITWLDTWDLPNDLAALSTAPAGRGHCVI
jgi:hypothetical protein